MAEKGDKKAASSVLKGKYELGRMLGHGTLRRCTMRGI
ncbi:unnamed protein product [Rhodiola kirilowii]